MKHLSRLFICFFLFVTGILFMNCQTAQPLPQCEAAKCAMIKLVRVHSTYLARYSFKNGRLVLNKKYEIQIQKNWEKNDGSAFLQNSSFSESAIFSVPPDTYEITLRAKCGPYGIIENIDWPKPFIFAPGAKYEIHLYGQEEFDNISGYRACTIRIEDIKKVKKF